MGVLCKHARPSASVRSESTNHAEQRSRPLPRTSSQPLLSTPVTPSAGSSLSPCTATHPRTTGGNPVTSLDTGVNMSNNLPADPVEEPELDEGEESDEYEFEVRE